MANGVLDYFRGQGDQFSSMSQNDLTQHIGENYPEFLQDPDFSYDFENLPKRRELQGEMARRLESDSSLHPSATRAFISDALGAGDPGGLSPSEARQYDTGDITPNYTLPYTEKQIRKIQFPDEYFGQGDVPVNARPNETGDGSTAYFADKKLPVGLEILAQDTENKRVDHAIKGGLNDTPLEWVPKALAIPGRVGNEAGRWAKAVLADTAAAAIDYPEGGGNMRSAHGTEKMPVDAAIESAAEEEKQDGDFGWKSTLAKMSLGAADAVAKILVAKRMGAAIGPGRVAEALGTGLTFGADEDGNFNPKGAAVGAIIPKVGELSHVLSTKLIKAGLEEGVTQLESSSAQKAIHFGVNQAVLDTTMAVAESPELYRLSQEDPREFKRRLVEIAGSNLGFSIPGLFSNTKPITKPSDWKGPSFDFKNKPGSDTPPPTTTPFTAAESLPGRARGISKILTTQGVDDLTAARFAEQLDSVLPAGVSIGEQLRAHILSEFKRIGGKFGYEAKQFPEDPAVYGKSGLSERESLDAANNAKISNPKAVAELHASNRDLDFGGLKGDLPVAAQPVSAKAAKASKADVSELANKMRLAKQTHDKAAATAQELDELIHPEVWLNSQQNPGERSAPTASSQPAVISPENKTTATTVPGTGSTPSREKIGNRPGETTSVKAPVLRRAAPSAPAPAKPPTAETGAASLTPAEFAANSELLDKFHKILIAKGVEIPKHNVAVWFASVGGSKINDLSGISPQLYRSGRQMIDWLAKNGADKADIDAMLAIEAKRADALAAKHAAEREQDERRRNEEADAAEAKTEETLKSIRDEHHPIREYKEESTGKPYFRVIGFAPYFSTRVEAVAYRDRVQPIKTNPSKPTPAAIETGAKRKPAQSKPVSTASGSAPEAPANSVGSAPAASITGRKPQEPTGTPGAVVNSSADTVISLLDHGENQAEARSLVDRISQLEQLIGDRPGPKKVEQALALAFAGHDLSPHQKRLIANNRTEMAAVKGQAGYIKSVQAMIAGLKAEKATKEQATYVKAKAVQRVAEVAGEVGDGQDEPAWGEWDISNAELAKKLLLGATNETGVMGRSTRKHLILSRVVGGEKQFIVVPVYGSTASVKGAKEKPTGVIPFPDKKPVAKTPAKGAGRTAWTQIPGSNPIPLSVLLTNSNWTPEYVLRTNKGSKQLLPEQGGKLSQDDVDTIVDDASAREDRAGSKSEGLNEAADSKVASEGDNVLAEVPNSEAPQSKLTSGGGAEVDQGVYISQTAQEFLEQHSIRDQVLKWLEAESASGVELDAADWLSFHQERIMPMAMEFMAHVAAKGKLALSHAQAMREAKVFAGQMVDFVKETIQEYNNENTSRESGVIGSDSVGNRSAVDPVRGQAAGSPGTPNPGRPGNSGAVQPTVQTTAGKGESSPTKGAVKFSLASGKPEVYTPKNPVPVGDSLSLITEEDFGAVVDLDYKLKDHLTTLTGSGSENLKGYRVDPSEVNLHDPAEQERLGITPEIKDAIEKALGVRIVFVNQKGRILFEGIHSIPGYVFISDHTPVNQDTLPLFLHEVAHEMAIHHPDLLLKLFKVLKEGLKEGVWDAELAKQASILFKFEGGVEPTADNINVRTEAAAELLRKLGRDPGFWSKLAKKSPELFKQLADIAMGILTKIINAFRNVVGGTLEGKAKDYEKLKSQVAALIAEYADRRSGTGKIRTKTYETEAIKTTDNGIDRQTGAAVVMDAGAGITGRAQTIAKRNLGKANERAIAIAEEAFTRIVNNLSRTSAPGEDYTSKLAKLVKGGVWGRYSEEDARAILADAYIARYISSPLDHISDPEIRSGIAELRKYIPLIPDNKVKDLFLHSVDSPIIKEGGELLWAVSDAAWPSLWKEDTKDDLIEHVVELVGSLEDVAGFLDRNKIDYSLSGLNLRSEITKAINKARQAYLDIDDGKYNGKSPEMEEVFGNNSAAAQILFTFSQPFRDWMSNSPDYAPKNKLLGRGSESVAVLADGLVYKLTHQPIALQDHYKLLTFNDSLRDAFYTGEGGSVMPILQRIKLMNQLPGMTPTQLVGITEDGKYIVRQPSSGKQATEAWSVGGKPMTEESSQQRVWEEWAKPNGWTRLETTKMVPGGGDVFQSVYLNRLPNGNIVLAIDVNARNLGVNDQGKVECYDPVLKEINPKDADKPIRVRDEHVFGKINNLPSPETIAPVAPRQPDIEGKLPNSITGNMRSGEIRFSLADMGKPEVYKPKNPVRFGDPLSSITTEDLEAISRLNSLLESGREVFPSKANLSDPLVQAHLGGFTPELKDALQSAFGLRIALVNQPRSILFNAVQLPGYIFVSDHKGSAAMRFIGHELGHEIEVHDPQTFKAISKLLLDALNEGELGKLTDAVKRRHASNKVPISEGELTGEVVGDLLGEAFEDPALLEKLAKKNPTVFAKLAKFAMDVLNKIVNYLRQSGPSLRDRVQDYEQLQDRLVELLSKYGDKRSGKTLTDIYAKQEPYTHQGSDPLTGAVIVTGDNAGGGARSQMGKGRGSSSEVVSRNRSAESRAREVIQRVIRLESRIPDNDWSEAYANVGKSGAADGAVRNILTEPLGSITDPELKAAVKGLRELVPLVSEEQFRSIMQHPVVTKVDQWISKTSDSASSEGDLSEFDAKLASDRIKDIISDPLVSKALDEPGSNWDSKQLLKWADDLVNTRDLMMVDIIADAILTNGGFQKAFRAAGEHLGQGSTATAYKLGDYVYKKTRGTYALSPLNKGIGFSSDDHNFYNKDDSGGVPPLLKLSTTMSQLPGVAPQQVVGILPWGDFIVRQPMAGDALNDKAAMLDRGIDTSPLKVEEMLTKWAAENGYGQYKVNVIGGGGDVFRSLFFKRLQDGSVVALADVNIRNMAVGKDGKLVCYDPLIRHLTTSEAASAMRGEIDDGVGGRMKVSMPAPNKLAPELPVTERSVKAKSMADEIGSPAVRYSLADMGNDALADATEIPRIAEGELVRIGKLASGISSQKYNNALYRKSVSDLNKLYASARDAAIIGDIDPSAIPTPSSELFLEALRKLGIKHDPEQVESQQKAIAFERLAVGFSRRTEEVAMLRNLIHLTEGLPGSEPLITKYALDASALSLWLKKHGPIDNDGDTVRQRGMEILEANQDRPIHEANRRALLIPEIQDNFVAPIAAVRDLFDRFPELASETWEGKLAERDSARAQKLTLAVNAVLQQIDLSFSMLKDRQTAEEKAKRDKVNKLMAGSREASEDASLAELVLSDAVLAMAGEGGLTGDVINSQMVEWLRLNQSAVAVFASRLASVVDNASYRAAGEPSPDAAIEAGKRILEWMRDPVGDAPLLPLQGHSGEFGVAENTLDTLFKMMASSDVFRDAVTTLVEQERGDVPMDKLAEIALRVSNGDKKAAKTMFDSLVRMKSKERAKLAAQANASGREAAKLKADLDAYSIAVGVFESLRASPEFRRLRQLSESALNGYYKRMLNSHASTANSASAADRVRLEPFSIGSLDQPEVSITVSDFNFQSFPDKVQRSIEQWRDSAERYVTGYEAAESDYVSGISPNTPSSLGYDTPTYRGIKLVLEHDLPVLLNPSNFDSSTSLSPSRLQLKWNSIEFVTQIHQVASNLGGVLGGRAKAMAADYSNTVGEIAAVSNRDRFWARDLPALRSAALKSHPEFNGNMDLYRRMQNEAGNIGRRAGSLLAAGSVLPSGHVITAEDMAWFKRMLEYTRALLTVNQKRGDQATGVEVAGRQLSRFAASVGKFEFTRIINPDGVEVSSQLADLLKLPAFTPATDLTATSTDPVVKGWNGLAGKFDVLTSHVLDSTRDDLAIIRSGNMRTALRSVAALVEASGGGMKFATVGELVDALVAAYPTGTGRSVRDTVINEVSSELTQYMKLADKRIQPAVESKQDILGAVDTVNKNSEFSNQAGLLELPSVFYDHGTLTDQDARSMEARAAASSLLELAKALIQAEHELQSRITVVEPGTRPGNPIGLPTGWSLSQLELLHFAVRRLNEVLLRRDTTPSPLGKVIRGGIGLAVRSLLMSPKVALRNITQGMTAVYLVSSKLNEFGRTVALIKSLAGSAAVISKYATRIAASVPGLQSSLRYLKSKHPATYASVFQWAESLYRKYIQDGIEDVRGLGFGRKGSFMETVRQALREAAEFQDDQDLSRSFLSPFPKTRKALRVAGAAFSGTTKGIESKFGLTNSDLVLNTQVKGIVDNLVKVLKRAALLHGARPGVTRDTLVNSEDMSRRFLSSDKLQHTADIREMLQMAGIPLEHVLLDYHQRSGGGTADVPLFTDAQMDSLKRLIIGLINSPNGINRAQAIKSDRMLSAAVSLRGYIFDYTGKLFGEFRSVAGRSNPSRFTHALSTAMMLGLAAFLFGIASLEVPGQYDRKVLHQFGKIIPSDASFWNGNGLTLRSASAMLSNLGQVGDVVLTALNIQQGGKGFDIGSKLLPLTLITDAVKSMTAFFVLPPEDWDIVIKGLADRFAPLASDLRSMLGYKSRVSGQSAMTEAGKIVDPKSNASKAIPYAVGPTTGIKTKWADALYQAHESMLAGDSAGAAEHMREAKRQMQRLTDYYIHDRGMDEKKAEAAVRRDYSAMNPATRSNGGKTLTDSEYEQRLAALSPSQRVAWGKTLGGWQMGESFFSDSSGSVINTSPSRTPRSEGGGSSSRTTRARTRDAGEELDSESSTQTGGVKLRSRGSGGGRSRNQVQSPDGVSESSDVEQLADTGSGRVSRLRRRAGSSRRRTGGSTTPRVSVRRGSSRSRSRSRRSRR